MSSCCPTKRCANAGSMTPISRTSPARSFFQPCFRHERSDLSHWRNRLGSKRELLHAAIRGLNRLVKEHGGREHAVRLRQSYLRVAKRVAMMVGLAAVGGRPYQYFSRQRLRL